MDYQNKLGLIEQLILKVKECISAGVHTIVNAVENAVDVVQNVLDEALNSIKNFLGAITAKLAKLIDQAKVDIEECIKKCAENEACKACAKIGDTLKQIGQNTMNLTNDCLNQKVDVVKATVLETKDLIHSILDGFTIKCDEDMKKCGNSLAAIPCLGGLTISIPSLCLTDVGTINKIVATATTTVNSLLNSLISCDMVVECNVFQNCAQVVSDVVDCVAKYVGGKSYY